MRLYGGTSSTNGVLQICREGVWGNINSYAWSTYEAVLACRQLGLPTQCKLRITLCPAVYEWFQHKPQ